MIYYNNNLDKKVNVNNFESKDCCIVLDFDKTITTKYSANSWSVLASEDGFCKEVCEAATRYAKQYAPIEVNYDIPLEQRMEKVIEWYKKDMDLFYEYNLTEEILYHCIDIAKLEFRAGLKELFRWAHEKGIIVVIVSAGIRNIIVEFLKRENCNYDNIQILSNHLNFENGKMKKFENDLTHTYNKNLDRLSFEIKEKINNMKNILLFGDLIEDIGIVDNKDLHRTLTVGFLETNVEGNLDNYQENYDIVLTDEDASFNKIIEILNLKD